MANRSDRGSGHPAQCPGHNSPQSRMGPDPRKPSWPAVTCTAQTGRTQDCTRPPRQHFKSLLATREPSTQDIAYEEIIVRRGNRFDCPLFPLLADVGWVAPLSRLVANSGLSDKTNEQWLWSSAAAILALRSRWCEPSTASKTEMPANRFLRPLSGVKLKKRKPIFGL